jgi:hypothetical protein
MLALLCAMTLAACEGASAPVSANGTTAGAITTNGVTADISFQSDWTAGYCANVVIGNGSASPVTGWTVVIALNQSTVSQQPWGGVGTVSGGLLTVKPADYTANIAPGASVSFGFCGSATGSNYHPTLSTLSVVGGGSGTTSYALTVQPGGTGAGTVSSTPAGISCGTTCSASYASGTTVTLTAAPAAGSTFASWAGACTGAAACVVTMTAARTVTATFNVAQGTTYALTVSKGGTGSGTVTSSTGGINCGTTCSASYASGTTVTLTAAPAAGSTFASWAGACTGAAACIVSMTAARTVTATFDGGTQTWPQCYANGKMPANPVLTVNTGNTGYSTVLTNGGNSYVAMLVGPSRQACITDAVANFDVSDLTGEIRDVVEGLGFPPFDEWAKGHYLNWVILNSGIPGKTLSGQGGHQGVDMAGNMDFESTEECPCNWGTGDNSNRGNALHESIHALQAQLWAFNNSASGWVHEAHNCYLGTQRTAVVYGRYTMGYGAAVTLQMPFVPIESMGLLTDGSIGGPADQGASGKTYVNSVTRYGLEIFFLSLNLSMGRGFINCMWMDAPRNNQKSVFQVLQSYAGNEGAANAVQTFAARSSLLDFGAWTAVVRTTMQSNWNNSWWFYMYPGSDGTTTFRPPTNQIPHHQGRNIIPIKLATGATSVTVEFTPDATGSAGTAENMRAQLTYRTTDDKPVYGTVFTKGQSTIQVPSGARNGIVNLVVAVTNPNAASGSDDGSNKGFNAQEHFNYSARIVSGGTIAPTTTRPW